MQVSTSSVITSKKNTYTEWCVGFGRHQERTHSATQWKGKQRTTGKSSPCVLCPLNKTLDLNVKKEIVRAKDGMGRERVGTAIPHFFHVVLYNKLFFGSPPTHLLSALHSGKRRIYPMWLEANRQKEKVWRCQKGVSALVVCIVTPMMTLLPIWTIYKGHADKGGDCEHHTDETNYNRCCNQVSSFMFWEKQAKQTTATISNGWTIVIEVLFQRCEKVLGQCYVDQKNNFCPGARQLKPLIAFR